MKLNFGTLVMTFFWSMFAGIIIFSIGLGAAVPVLHRIATPLVCSEGKMISELEYYSYQPGESTTTLAWLCVNNKTGEKQDITFKATLVAGVLYGFIFFALSIVFMLSRKKPESSSDRQTETPISHQNEPFSPVQSDSLQIRQKLETLRELRDSDLITEQEYERKKSEVLREL